MRNRLKLILVLPAFLLVSTLSQAQVTTNLTDFLGVTSLGTSTAPDFNAHSPSMASTLHSKGADCFLITFELSPIAIPSADMPILYFNVEGSNTGSEFMRVGISSGKNGWYVDRKYVTNGNVKWIRYRSYDKIGYDGKFTLILSRNFIGLARDESGTGRWFFTPMFFGLDSNLGYAGSSTQADEYLGVATDSSPARIFSAGALRTQNKPISVFYYCKGGGSCSSVKIKDLISAIDSQVANDNTVNQRMGEEAHEAPTVTVNDEPFIYPNPSEGMINISLTTETKEHVKLRVFDQSGVLVMEQAAEVEAGTSIVSLLMPGGTGAGMYYLRVETAEGSHHFRFVLE